MTYLFPATQYAVMTSDHGNSTTTGTEVTDLKITLPAAGTYRFDYRLLAQTSNTTTGISLGLNFDGGAPTKLVFNLTYVCSDDLTSATTNATHETSSSNQRVFEGHHSATESTTTPSVTTNGFVTTNADALIYITGVIIVAAGGELELWHASQDANETRVENGSTVVVTRFA